MIQKEKYFKETENAVRSLFSCIGEYRDLFKLSISPIKAFQHTGEEDFKKKYAEWRSEPKVIEQHVFADYAREEFHANIFSMYVISGSILQIVNKAIELFSNNTEVKPKYAYLFERCNNLPNNKIKKFCIGRDVRNVPLGLAIYAGRNQYNHLEVGRNLHTLNVNIFEALATVDEDKGYRNPAFDLSNELLDSYSFNILGLLDWNSYEDYQTDMQKIFSSNNDKTEQNAGVDRGLLSGS